MIKRKYRATRANIDEAMKTGISVSGGFVYAKISKTEAKDMGFAIVVSKKIEKTSVGRHLIKRKISSYIEENLSKINPNFKKTVVFVVKKIDGLVDYIKAKKDVESILEKVAF